MNITQNRAGIKLLDELTICKIAAGEVILSPAYVIKELVENSIDAGATEIIVDIKGAGVSKIAIRDNGCGMTRDDILMALEHHATSKLRNVEDLKQIRTYGFRGEALPSIVSVSQAEIISSIDSEKPGISVKIEGGVIKAVQPAAASKGTHISIKNLFFNTPVRRKFLKSDNYETAMIVDTMTKYALAHPEIKFTLYSNEREVISIPSSSSSVKSVIESIFPADISDNLIERNIAAEIPQCGMISIKGYFAPPHISRPNGRTQYYFVNRRPFKNKTLSHAVYEAYQKHLNPRQHPILFVFIEMDQQFVDINIHPTKAEAAFTCEFKLHDLMLELTNKALINPNVIPDARLSGTFGNIAENKITHNLYVKQQPGTAGDYEELSKKEISEPSLSVIKPENKIEKIAERVEETPVQNELGFQETAFLMSQMSRPVMGAGNDNFENKLKKENDGANISRDSQTVKNPIISIKRIIGQAFDSFVLLEDVDGILIIDQHVAAEKVLYEKILKSLREKSINSQVLLIPRVYELGAAEFALISNAGDTFAKYGFEIEVFSNKTIAVRAVPGFIDEKVEKEFLFEIISSCVGGSKKIDEELFIKNLAATMSCKAAVKAGKSLSDDALKLLIKDLMLCDDPYFCPHGRPVIIKLPLNDLLQKFKRSL